MKPNPDLQSKAETGSELRRSKRVRCATGKIQDIEDILSSGTPNKYLSTHPHSSESATKNKGVPHPAPARWRETYDKIANMRSREIADVDTSWPKKKRLIPWQVMN